MSKSNPANLRKKRFSRKHLSVDELFDTWTDFVGQNCFGSVSAIEKSFLLQMHDALPMLYDLCAKRTGTFSPVGLRGGHEVFRTLVDALDANIVVLDEQGHIIFANLSWIEFGKENGSPEQDWVGVDYLEAVDHAAESGDNMAAEAAEGIRRVLGADESSFEQIYPCHSRDEYRFYSLKVRAFIEDGRRLLAVCHSRQLNMDSLTGLPNRQLFSHGLRNELSRARRGHAPVSLMLIDVDYFKQANDTYGHVFGDECLRAIAAAISRHARRPSDLAARYGGDEFVLLLGMTAVEDALQIAESIHAELECMAICCDGEHCITLSIGLAQIWPTCGDLRQDELLIAAADAALYEAKRQGRNRVVCLSDCVLAALPDHAGHASPPAELGTLQRPPYPQACPPGEAA